MADKNLTTAWKPGQSGNPKGKPKGARNKATLLALALMEDELDGIVKSVIKLAKDGDMTAARLIVDKLVPAARSRPLTIKLPDLKDIEACRVAQASIVSAVALGELLPDDGEAISALVENQRRGLESEHILTRLIALEEKYGAKR